MAENSRARRGSRLEQDDGRKMCALRRGGLASNITLAWECPNQKIALQRPSGGLSVSVRWHAGSTYHPSPCRCTYGPRVALLRRCFHFQRRDRARSLLEER